MLKQDAEGNKKVWKGYAISQPTTGSERDREISKLDALIRGSPAENELDVQRISRLTLTLIFRKFSSLFSGNIATSDKNMRENDFFTFLLPVTLTLTFDL